MAETPKFKVGDLVRTKTMKVVSVRRMNQNVQCEFPNNYGVFFSPECLEPIPPPPSGDDVEKLLKRLDGETYPFAAIPQAAALIRSLQSELASLRAQVEGERDRAWNEAIEAAHVSLFAASYDMVEPEKIELTRQLANSVRALTRPTAPQHSPQAKPAT